MQSLLTSEYIYNRGSVGEVSGVCRHSEEGKISVIFNLFCH